MSVDELGRVVLCVEARARVGLKARDNIELFINGNEIIIRKFVPKCIFCRGENGVIQKMGKYVCKKCISEIA